MFGDIFRVLLAWFSWPIPFALPKEMTHASLWSTSFAWMLCGLGT
jgi:hypothetical protein